MKKDILILSLIFINFFSFAQEEVPTSSSPVVAIPHLEIPKPRPNEVILDHTGYTLSYNTTYKQAEWVAYKLTADEKAVYIVTGGILTNGLPTIGGNKVTVPQYFYKVILDYTEPDIKAIGFIIPNKSSQEPLQHYAVTIDSVEKVTNIDFFYQLPDDQEKVIESKIDLNKWYW